jgi:hypothetical protein
MDHYETLGDDQLKLLVSGTAGGPHNRKRTRSLLVILRGMSEEDRDEAFTHHGIAKPAIEGIQEDLIEDDVVDGAVDDVMERDARDHDVVRGSFRSVDGRAHTSRFSDDDHDLERRVQLYTTTEFKEAAGEMRIDMIADWSDKDVKAYGRKALNEGRRAGVSPVKEKDMIAIMKYSLDQELSVFNNGKPVLSMMDIQLSYKTLSFYLSMFFKEKVSGMEDLMQRYLRLWNNQGVSFEECKEFEFKIRMLISDNLRDYSYKAVEAEFLYEWNEIRMRGFRMPVRDLGDSRDPRDSKRPRLEERTEKRICFAYNDRRECKQGKACRLIHSCMCCGKSHRSCDCPQNNPKLRAIEIQRAMIKEGERGGRD